MLPVLAGCGSAGHRQAAAADPARPSRPPVRAGVRLTVRRLGHLPAPVQLPAVARLGHGVVAAGGLDAGDASTAAVVRVDPAPFSARQIGALPAPLHDAAAATTGTRTLLAGGGDAGAGRSDVLRILPSGATRPAGLLPAGA